MKKIIVYSFEKWCVKNNRQDLLDRWDYSLNEKLPSEVECGDKNKYWFKCPRNIHESELKNIQYFAHGKQKNIYCEKCESFGQFIIDNYGEDYLTKIWGNNVKGYYSYRKKSNKKVNFVCENNKTHKYDMTCYSYSIGQRCSYCSHQKRCIEESLGGLYNEIFGIWSDKNQKTPYDYTPMSTEKVWFKCKNRKHDDFQRTINQIVYHNFYCPICSRNKSYENQIEDLTGQKFNHLTAIKIDTERTKKGTGTFWLCQCDCGNPKLKSVHMSHLKNGGCTSCGCVHDKPGERNPNWKGGVTPINLRNRQTHNVKEWRRLILQRDNNVCQCCGAIDNLNVHHIYNFASNIQLRSNISNGITMCKDCHAVSFIGSFHNTYGTSNNTPEQLEEYINNKRKQLGIDIPFNINDYLNGDILKPNETNERKVELTNVTT